MPTPFYSVRNENLKNKLLKEDQTLLTTPPKNEA